MKRYGVLGQYLPAFAQVIGLMQYDLFHRYTVDAHTLLLVRILHRFTQENANQQYEEQFPLVSSLYRRIDRKEILILAAIFHDIAKGRGGDHSELGETEAINFVLPADRPSRCGFGRMASCQSFVDVAYCPKRTFPTPKW